MNHNKKKTDLLQMSKKERVKLIKRIKAELHRKRPEVKFWNSLVQMESLTINGQQVFQENRTFEGLRLE